MPALSFRIHHPRNAHPAQVDPVGCAAIAGDWLSVYDDVTWSDPAELEIDHVVALKEAWDSGAWAWDPARRSAFGNDLLDVRSLRAVTGSVNQSKSANDPSNWLPPNDGFVCEYLADWVSIKARWGLSMDQSERGRIGNLLADRCSGQIVVPWPETPPAPPPPPPMRAAPVARRRHLLLAVIAIRRTRRCASLRRHRISTAARSADDDSPCYRRTLRLRRSRRRDRL